MNNILANNTTTSGITSALTASTNVGVASTYTITSSLSSPAFTATYNGSATLPTGFSLSGATISVSTSAAAGTYNIVIGATTGTSPNFTAGSFATLVYTVSSVSAPTAQPTSAAFTSIGTTGFTANWTNGTGTGTNSLVVVYLHSPTPTTPSGTYTANAAYTSGSAIGTGYVVYNGNGN